MRKYKTIYALWLHIKLKQRGFKPISIIPNLEKDGFVSWIYENTEEFQEAFDYIMRERGER